MKERKVLSLAFGNRIMQEHDYVGVYRLLRAKWEVEGYTHVIDEDMIFPQSLDSTFPIENVIQPLILSFGLAAIGLGQLEVK
jgi:hypothetical protein